MLGLCLLLLTELAPLRPDAPNRQPALAAEGRTVALAYGAGHSISVAISNDGGRSFQQAVVVSDSGKLALGMHRGPRMAMAPGAMVVTAVVGEKGGGADGDILCWRSANKGRSWAGPVRVNDVPGSAREGLHAMASGGGLFFVTWLDLRRQGTRVYGAISRDGGATWSRNLQVYESPSGSVCECCHPSAAVSPSGEIYVMFRNWLDGARDMYLAKSPDGERFEPARKLGTGTWPLNACPMDGGGMVLERKGYPATAWRRDGEVYFLDAGSREEQKLGTGKNPAIAIQGGRPVVAWSQSRAIQYAFPDRDQLMTLTSDGAFPRLVSLEDGGVVAAWESKGSIMVQRLE